MDSPLQQKRVPRILVVDDNVENASLMSQLLQSRGYGVRVAHNAFDAEREIRSQLPDLILLDVIMPGKSGYDLCRELKAEASTRLIPLVMITGLTDREDKIRGIEAGADDFLNKPIFPEELFARVRSLLKLKEYTDETGARRGCALHARTERRGARSLHRGPLRAAGALRQRHGAPPEPGRGRGDRAAPGWVSARPGKNHGAGRSS